MLKVHIHFLLGHIQIYQRNGFGGIQQRAHPIYPGVWKDRLLNENAISSTHYPILIQTYIYAAFM